MNAVKYITLLNDIVDCINKDKPIPSYPISNELISELT